MLQNYQIPSITFLALPNIYLAGGFLSGNYDVAVTVMSYSRTVRNSIEPSINTLPILNFAIYWGPTIYNAGADVVPDSLDTFIHELTHVWQGYNEGSRVFNYMVRSLASQAWGIVSSLDRGNAYSYDASNYLKWSDYNVEQQGNIVRDWFSCWSLRSNRGCGSVNDPRFVYIDKIIRPGKPYAADMPTTYQTQNTQQHPAGFSPAVQAYQKLLIKKGYQIKDDGFDGQRTDKAVRDFQRHSGLKDDGVVGLKTLALLNRP